MSGESIEIDSELWHETRSECERLKAERAEARRQVSWLEVIRLPHARKQENANGFQRGWHAALSRVSEGDAGDDLAMLVPLPAAEVEIPVCAAEAENAQLRADLAEARKRIDTLTPLFDPHHDRSRLLTRIAELEDGVDFRLFREQEHELTQLRADLAVYKASVGEQDIRLAGVEVERDHYRTALAEAQGRLSAYAVDYPKAVADLATLTAKQERTVSDYNAILQSWADCRERLVEMTAKRDALFEEATAKGRLLAASEAKATEEKSEHERIEAALRGDYDALLDKLALSHKEPPLLEAPTRPFTVSGCNVPPCSRCAASEAKWVDVSHRLELWAVENDKERFSGRVPTFLNPHTVLTWMRSLDAERGEEA